MGLPTKFSNDCLVCFDFMVGVPEKIDVGDSGLLRLTRSSSSTDTDFEHKSSDARLDDLLPLFSVPEQKLPMRFRPIGSCLWKNLPRYKKDHQRLRKPTVRRENTIYTEPLSMKFSSTHKV